MQDILHLNLTNLSFKNQAMPIYLQLKLVVFEPFLNLFILSLYYYRPNLERMRSINSKLGQSDFYKLVETRPKVDDRVHFFPYPSSIIIVYLI